MHISDHVKWISNWVGMPVAVGLTGCALGYPIACCITKIVNGLIETNQIKEKTFEEHRNKMIAIVVAIPTILTFVVLPRILPFTKVSHGVVPNWNWEWIEARLLHR